MFACFLYRGPGGDDLPGRADRDGGGDRLLKVTCPKPEKHIATEVGEGFVDWAAEDCGVIGLLRRIDIPKDKGCNDDKGADSRGSKLRSGW